MQSTITRRQFLMAGAAAAGSTALSGGLWELLKYFDRRATHPASYLITSANETFVPSVCLLCPSGCGIVARVVEGRVIKLEGNPVHPINAGVLCPKGQAALELLYNPDRLTNPLRRSGERGSGEWQEITWDEAVQEVAGKLTALREAGTPERSAFLYG